MLNFTPLWALVLLLACVCSAACAESEFLATEHSLVEVLNSGGGLWTLAVGDGVARPAVLERQPSQRTVSLTTSQEGEEGEEGGGSAGLRSVYCEEYGRSAGGRCFLSFGPEDSESVLYFSYRAAASSSYPPLSGAPLPSAGEDATSPRRRRKAAVAAKTVGAAPATLFLESDEAGSGARVGTVAVAHESRTRSADRTETYALELRWQLEAEAEASRALGVPRGGRLTLRGLVGAVGKALDRQRHLRRAAQSSSLLYRWGYPLVIALVVYGLLRAWQHAVVVQQKRNSAAAKAAGGTNTATVKKSQ